MKIADKKLADEKMAKIMYQLRDYGQETKYMHTRYGLNSRLDELQASVLREKLRFLDKDNNKRSLIAKRYVDRLLKNENIKMILPSNFDDSNFHLFGIKTSKRDLLKEYSPETIRYFILQTNYRHKLDFTTENLDAAKTSFERIKRRIVELKKEVSKGDDSTLEYESEFIKAINDDLDMPKALAVLWNLVRDEKAEGKIKTIKEMDKVFSLDLSKKENLKIPKEIIKLVNEREKARKNKDYNESDKIRKEIRDKGYTKIAALAPELV